MTSTREGDAQMPDAAASTSAPKQYTFVMDSSEIASGEEFYGCQDVPSPFGKDIAIVKTESKVSPGTHHMYAFQIPSKEAAFTPDAGLYAAEGFGPGDAGKELPFKADGMKTPVFACPAGGLEFHPYFHLTQRAEDSIEYPAGIGRSLLATEAIRLQVHYLNTTASPIQVTAQVTVTYVPPDAVEQLAGGIFVFSQSLKVPPGVSTQKFKYAVPADMSFLQVTGHMHRRGVHYEAHATDAAGKVRPLYSSDTWNEPKTLDLDPPFAFKKGDTINWSCKFDNETDKTLVYGESAASNEMCNMFGVYFPAQDGQTILGAL
jgi:hypothetical protein